MTSWRFALMGSVRSIAAFLSLLPRWPPPGSEPSAHQLVSAPRQRVLSRGRPIRTARRRSAGAARRTGHDGPSDPSGPCRPECSGRRRQGGASGGHVVDHQHPEPRDRVRHEHRAPTALHCRPPGLGRAAPPGEAGTDGHAEAPADRPGEMLRLVEAPAPAPDGRGRRPRDDVDRARGLLPQPLDQRRGQDRQGGPRVAVLEPGQRLPHRPFVGEGRHPPVDRRWWGLPGRARPGALDTGGADRRRRPAAPDATSREERLDQAVDGLHWDQPTEGV